jgi:hypothetical protein
VGSVVWDVRKKKKEFAAAVLKLTEIVGSGYNRTDALFINVLDSIMFSFAVCVRSFHVNGWLIKLLGTLI